MIVNAKDQQNQAKADCQPQESAPRFPDLARALQSQLLSRVVQCGEGNLQLFQGAIGGAGHLLKLRILAEVFFHEGARGGAGFAGEICWQQINDHFAFQSHEPTSPRACLACISFNRARWTLTFTVAIGRSKAWAISSYGISSCTRISSAARSTSARCRKAAMTASSSAFDWARACGVGEASGKDSWISSNLRLRRKWSR